MWPPRTRLDPPAVRAEDWIKNPESEHAQCSPLEIRNLVAVGKARRKRLKTPAED